MSFYVLHKGECVAGSEDILSAMECMKEHGRGSSIEDHEGVLMASINTARRAKSVANFLEEEELFTKHHPTQNYEPAIAQHHASISKSNIYI